MQRTALCMMDASTYLMSFILADVRVCFRLCGSGCRKRDLAASLSPAVGLAFLCLTAGTPASGIRHTSKDNEHIERT